MTCRCLVVLFLTVGLISAQQPGLEYHQVKQAIRGLEWKSDGFDSEAEKFKPLFIAAPKDERIEQTLEGWVGLFPGKGRPECTECIEAEEFDTFIDERMEDHADDSETVEEDTARWQRLSTVMGRHLKGLAVYSIGGIHEPMRIVVLCGVDSGGNLVGCWARHWNS